MVDFGAIVGHLERRARRSRALRWGGMMLLVGGVTVLAAAWTLRALSFPLPRPWMIALGVPCLLAAAGYAIGRLRSVHVPTVLLRADVALDLDARLSTLYQIQDEPTKAPFASRIAARLPGGPLDLRRAFPVRPRDVILLMAGTALATAAIVLGNVPVRNEAVDALSAEPIASGSVAVDDPAPSATWAGDPTRQDPDQGVAGEVAGSSSPSALALADILAEIRPRGSGETGRAGGPDLEDLPSRVRSDRTLEEVLQEIQRRLASEGGTLSMSEVETLRGFRNVASSPLADRLERILDAADSETSLALITDLLADEPLRSQSRNLHLGSGEGLPQEDLERSDEGGQSSAVTGDSSPALSGLAPEDEPAGSDMAEPSSSDRIPAFPLFEGATEHEGDIVVAGVDLPSAIGDEGAYNYYLTKGVPIEPLSTSDRSGRTDWSFSYERIDSIVSERALSNDVADTVKAYFKRISEGGS